MTQKNEKRILDEFDKQFISLSDIVGANGWTGAKQQFRLFLKKTIQQTQQKERERIIEIGNEIIDEMGKNSPEGTLKPFETGKFVGGVNALREFINKIKNL